MACDLFAITAIARNQRNEQKDVHMTIVNVDTFDTRFLKLTLCIR